MIESATVRTAKIAKGRWLWAVPGIQNSGRCQNVEITPITMDAPSNPKPDLGDTIPTAAKKGPKVPSTMNSGPTDGGTIPIPWLDATRGSQQSQEIPIALIVKMTAERVGESRGRITGRCNETTRPGLAF